MVQHHKLGVCEYAGIPHVCWRAENISMGKLITPSNNRGDQSMGKYIHTHLFASLLTIAVGILML